MSFLAEQILNSLHEKTELPTRIFLVGLPSCGKTKNGKIVAKALDYTFLDTDHFIEAEEGKTVKEIFAENGEAHFRELEKKYLHKLSKCEKIIIATGGGMACFNNNMEFMNQNGCTVWLNVPKDTLIERLELKSAKRPMTDGKTKAEIEALIDNLAEKRVVFYEQSEVIV